MKPIQAQLSDTYQAINTLLKIYEGWEHMPPSIFKLYNRYQNELIHLQNENMKTQKHYPNRDKTVQFPSSTLPYGFAKNDYRTRIKPEQMEEVIRLREQGCTYPQINEKLDTGLSDTGLRKACDRAKKKRQYVKEQSEKATDITG